MARLHSPWRRPSRQYLSLALGLALCLGVLLPPAAGNPVSAESLSWVTFLGNDTNDDGQSVALDVNGYVYVVGSSTGSWSETPVRQYSGDGTYSDAFVARLLPDGSLDWYTFLGGEGYDQGYGIAVDNQGSVFVTGRSDASWSNAGTPIRGHSVSWDVFVAELNADNGDLVWHTFLGGNGDDWGYSIAVNDSFLYAAGITSANWSETPSEGYSGNIDAFAAKLKDNGDLVWHTFLGGSGVECDNCFVGVAVGDDGNVWVTSASASEWSEPAVTGHSGGSDAFVARLDSGGHRIWHTFMGSAQSDSGNDISVDARGNAFVTGQSAASWGVDPVREHSGDQDGFAARLDANGELTWHTFLGGGSVDRSHAIAVDPRGNVYVVGGSRGTWGSPQHDYSAYWDAFAAKLSTDGALAWNTFVGGDDYDDALGVAVDDTGIITIAGYSTSGDWASDLIRDFSGLEDSIVVQFSVPLSTFVDVDISLATGWNMVSVPVTAADMSVDAIFPDAEAVYTWNPVTKSYSVPETIDPKKSYWVAVTEDDTVTVTGTPVTEWKDELTAGWNMAGSVYGDDVPVGNLVDLPDGAVQTNAIYHWNPGTKSYDVATHIVQGLGYWMACTEDCDLTMTAPV